MRVRNIGLSIFDTNVSLIPSVVKGNARIWVCCHVASYHHHSFLPSVAARKNSYLILSPAAAAAPRWILTHSGIRLAQNAAKFMRRLLATGLPPSNSYHFARRIYSRIMVITPHKTRQFSMMKGNLIRFLLLRRSLIPILDLISSPEWASGPWPRRET